MKIRLLMPLLFVCFSITSLHAQNSEINYKKEISLCNIFLSEYDSNYEYSATKVKDWAIKYKKIKILNDRLEEDLNKEHQLTERKIKL